jgi:hypothetical protein
MPLSLSISAIVSRSRAATSTPTAVVRNLIDEGCLMETAQRDALLGTATWWGFHALLLWMGTWHFLSRDLTDGSLFASDLFAGGLIGATVLSLLRLTVGCHLLRFTALTGILLVLYHVWQGKAEWGNLTDVAIWAYTFYSFGPNSWRYALYSPLGVFGKLKA